MDGPWANDPVAGPQPAAPPSVAPVAAPSDTAVPSDAPWSQDAPVQDINRPAKKVAGGYQTISGFEDELPAHAHPLPPELEHQLLDILSNDPLDTAASHARQVAAEHGVSVGPSTDPKYADSFAQTIAFRRQHGAISDSIINQLGRPNNQDYLLRGDAADTARATFRGAASILPVNTVDAALHTAADVVTGKTSDGIAADFNRNSDIAYGTQVGDEENHPVARLTGQLLGGLLIPSGYEGAALNAGKSVLRSGGSMVEARAAAAAAARTRLGTEGAAIGGEHGFDTAAPGQGVSGAVEGAAIGGAGGYALAKAGRFIAPRLAGMAGAAEDSAPDYAQLARELSIRRTPATNSGSGTATVVQSGLGALPGGTPVGHAAEREIADLGTAAKGVAEDVGQVSSRQGAGEAIAQGAQSYKQTSGAEGGGMYQQRDNLMGGPTAPVVLKNFDEAISDLNRQFPGSPAIQQLREHPVIRQVADAFEGSPQRESTLGEATEALSHVRGVLRNLGAKNDATPVVMSRVGKVEQGLENDVMDSARAADIANGRTPGEAGSAVQAQRDADAFWADRASALNGSLKRPLQSANDDTKVSGETVYNQVAGDMDAKAGNLARLRDTWFRLPPEAKSTFAATKIDDLGRATPGQQNDLNTAWSFQRFLTNLNSISPQARNIVFGAKADTDLQKIATYANRLRQLDRARNFSNTAKTYFAGAFMATVGGAVMHGDLGTAAEATMALPATWGGAKLLLASPAMRDWTAQAMRALTSNNESALKVLTKRLGSIASTNPTIASEASGLQQTIMRAANDNLRSLAASGGQQNPQGERNKAQGAR